MTPRFDLIHTAAGKWRFRLRAANGEIIAVSEHYETEQGARKGIDAIRDAAPVAEVVEETEEGNCPDGF